MELKMKYHYSYFIYPYVIEKSNFNKYIKMLLENKKVKPRFFNREKDKGIYNFFLPTIRKYMFSGFDLADSPSSIYDKLKENAFKAENVNMFEYDIGKDAQAKVEEEEGIFFRIEGMKIICFKPGICFLVIKADLEDTDRFADLLNFNVKFRDFNANVKDINNIKIQTSTFGDIKKLSDIIREITGKREESEKIDIDVNRFLTYSYVCIDQEYWNENRPFSDIKKEFEKFANVLNSEYNSNFENEKLQIVSLGNYIKVGVSTAGVSFLTSSINTINYTNLPVEFENEYLYTYIFTLYEKFYLSKLINDFGSHIKTYKTVKNFVKFTNDIWVHALTNSDNGNLIFEDMKMALELNQIYEKTKEQYDVAYKSFKMKNNDLLNKIILVLLAISVITNIINYINLYKLK